MHGLSEFRIKNKKGASNSVFEGRTSTGSGLFASLISGLVETLRQIVFIREKKDSNTNLLASRHIRSKKASFPVYVCRTKTGSNRAQRYSPFFPIKELVSGESTTRSDKTEFCHFKQYLFSICEPTNNLTTKYKYY